MRAFKSEFCFELFLQRILLDSARPLSTLNVGRGDSVLRRGMPRRYKNSRTSSRGLMV